MKRLLFFFIAGIVPLWFACNDDDDNTPLNIRKVEVGDTFSLKFGECVYVNVEDGEEEKLQEEGFYLCFNGIREGRVSSETCEIIEPLPETYVQSRAIVTLRVQGVNFPLTFMELCYCRTGVHKETLQTIKDHCVNNFRCDNLDTVAYMVFKNVKVYLYELAPYPVDSLYISNPIVNPGGNYPPNPSNYRAYFIVLPK